MSPFPQTIRKVLFHVLEVYLGYTWKTGKVSQLLPKLTAVGRRTSTSHRFRHQLTPHFAHRLFVYPQYGTVLFAKYSEQLRTAGQFLEVMPGMCEQQTGGHGANL